MHVQRLTSFNWLAPHRARWNQLAGGVPFRQGEWLEPWWRHFQAGRELYLLQVTNSDGEIVGLAPWFLEPNSISGRSLQALGSGEVCSDYLGVMTDPDCRSEVLEALATWLAEANRRGTPDAWDVLQLDGLDETDPAVDGLLASFERQGCFVHRQPGANCWRIPLSATWDEYLQGLPKPQRKRMRQARQALETDGRFRVVCVETADKWEDAWRQFVELHQRRRASLGQPGCFGNPAFGRFLDEAARSFVSQGQLRLVLVEKQDQPLAALLMLTGGNILYGYQMGTNPDCLADSPGWLVVCASLLTGIDHGDTALDLLRGDEPYKSRMGGKLRTMLQVRVVPDQLSSQLRHKAWLTSSAVKQWIKSGLHAAGLAPPAHGSGGDPSRA
jgi:CelD/BcsL family acetyltransferase involved in cellulose biosynthesis